MTSVSAEAQAFRFADTAAAAKVLQSSLLTGRFHNEYFIHRR